MMTARKVVHVAFGFVAFAVGPLGHPKVVMLLAAALLHNLFLLPRYTGRRLERGDRRLLGPDRGIALYPAILLALALVLPTRPDVLAAVWAILAFGDGAAALVGSRFPSPALPWNPRKSWAGSAAFLSAGGAGAAAALVLVPGPTGDGPRLPIALVAIAAAALGAAVESLDSALDDNLLVPPVAALSLLGLLAFTPPAGAAADVALARLAPALGANALLALAALVSGAASLAGAATGALLGSATWVALGPPGYAPFLLFVVLGSAATRVGRAEKERLGIGEGRRGRRGAANAVANTAIPVALAILALGQPDPVRRRILAAGSAAGFAAALADTLGSEIGKARRGATRLLTTLAAVAPGTDGGISAAGTTAAACGAVAGALAAVPLLGPSAPALLAVAAGGFCGMLADGLLGALLAKPRPADNHVVNVAGTLAGALVALLSTSLAAEVHP